MNYKAVKNLIKGDVVSFDNGKTRHTVVRKIMRNNDKYEVYFYDANSEYLYPNSSVRFYGKDKDKERWSDEEKYHLAKDIWEGLCKSLPNNVISALSGVYNADLFGKRGRYEQINKRYLKDDYNMVKQIPSKGVVNVILNQIECFDVDPNTSARLETECYGSYITNVVLILDNGNKVVIR